MMNDRERPIGEPMFKILKVGQNRLDIEMRGQLDAASMNLALDEIARKSEHIENGQMLYVITDFQLPTIGAIGIELSRLPSMLGLIKKFNRGAVLTDKKWLKKASGLEGTLIPGIAIKAFGLDDRDKAESWLSRSV